MSAPIPPTFIFLNEEQRVEIAHWLVSAIIHFFELATTTYRNDKRRFRGLCYLADYIASVIPELPGEALDTLKNYEHAIPELAEDRRALEKILEKWSLCG